MIRSRARWVELGEKSSKYFLNLKKRNFINKSITELKTSEDKVTKDQNEIINMQKNFYKSLYKEKITGEEVEYTPDISNLPKINEEQKVNLDREITKGEVEEALKSLKNNKSPGPDGYTAEFFKAFWQELGDFIYKSIIECFEKNKLPDSFNRGIITCVPKPGKTGMSCRIGDQSPC